MQKLRKFLALLTVFSLIILLGITCYFGITGNKNFFGMFALTMLVPVFLWVLMVLLKQKN